MNRIQSYIYSFMLLALICPNNLYAQAVSGTLNGHDYVDLGLSVKWATCNVGANRPSDYGNYYAWGETSTKSTYAAANSKTYEKDVGAIKGNSRYDAARANWGGTWRLPTGAEVQELVDKCTWKWITRGGHKGYKVTGPNGNSIFLPAAGLRYASMFDNVGDGGDYWTSTFEGNIYGAYELYFSSSEYELAWNYRMWGYSIRPVTR